MDNNIEKRGISQQILDKFSDWLQEKHPRCWWQYRNYARRFPEPQEFKQWVEGLPESERLHARKVARKLRDFLLAEGELEIAQQWGEACQRPVGLVKLRGTLRQRQMAAMRALWGLTGMSAKEIGALRLEDSAKVRERYPACSQILDEWLRIRVRCREDGEFFRRMRVRQQWATSEYLFPSPKGGPSRFREAKEEFLEGGDDNCKKPEAIQALDANEGWVFDQGIVFQGRIWLYRELHEEEKKRLSEEMGAVFVEGWFRQGEAGWEGPYVVPEV